MLFPEMPPAYPQGVFAQALGCGNTLPEMKALLPLALEKDLLVSVSPGCEAQVHAYLGEFGVGKYACGILGISYQPGFRRYLPDGGRWLPTEAEAWACAERVLKHFASGLRKRALLRLVEGLPAHLLVAVVIPLEGPWGHATACKVLGEAFPPSRIHCSPG